MRSKRSQSAAITFELQSFEYLRTGESDVLLRLEGAWVADSDRGVPGAELRLVDGDHSFVAEPLPDPSNFPVAATRAGTPWAAAFPASRDEVEDGHVRFVLSLTDGTTFDLPAPANREARPLPAPEPEPIAVEPEPTPAPEPAPAAEEAPADGPIAALPEADRIKAIIAESIERFGVLEQRIERERAGREEAERRLAAAEAARDEAVNAVSGSSQVRGHLEKAVEEANSARMRAEEMRDAALARVAELQSGIETRTDDRATDAELEQARAELAKLQSVVEVANAARQASEEELAQRDSVETALREQLSERDAELAAARAEAASIGARLEKAEEALSAAGEPSERVAELEERLADAERVAARVAELEEGMAASGESQERIAKLEAELASAREAALIRVAELQANAERVRELESVLAEAEKIADNRAGSEHDLREALAAAKAEANQYAERVEEADRAGEELSRRAREADEAAAESATALEAAVGERGRVEARLSQLEAELGDAKQLAGAEAMAREELLRDLDSGEGAGDEMLKRELEHAREEVQRERGQRASFEQELKRREDADFELRNTIGRLEAQIESLRGELASRDETVTDWKRRVEDTGQRLLAAERATADARVARAKLERDLRELSEGGDDADADVVLARHKSEMAELRSEIEAANGREQRAQRRIDELENAFAEGGADAQRQQILGEVDRLKAAAGRATELAQAEAKRRAELEDELESRVVAEERLRAMLQAKVAVSRNGDGDDDADAAEVEVELPPVAGAATAQGDFLERLAAAKSRAQSVES